jgi:hypothetical protein
MMIGFRQLLFHKVVHVLRQIGLLSEKVSQLLVSEALVRPDTLHGAA